MRIDPARSAVRHRPRLPYAFGFAQFRRLWLAALIGSFGSWMERVAVGWLVLDQTGSVLLAALSFAVQTAPNMVIGPLAGALADRIERRLLLAANSLMRAVILGAMAAVVFGNGGAVWMLLLLAALSGATRSLDLPASQALIGDIVGVSNLTNAIGLHTLGVRSVGMLGGLASGIAIDFFEPTPAFLVAAGLAVLSAAVYFPIRVEGPPTPAAGRSIWRDSLEGLRSLIAIPVVAMLMMLALVVEIFAFSYNSLLPGMAKVVLSVGAAGLGTLTLFAGLGALVGSAALSLVSRDLRKGPLMIGVALGYGAFLIAFAASDRMAVALPLIAGVGAMAAMFDVLQWTLLQASVPDALRGRAIGGWVWAIGFGWVGPIALGTAAEFAGVPWTIGVSGATVAALAIAAALFVPGLRRA